MIQLKDHLSSRGDVSLGNIVKPHINLKRGGVTKISLNLLGRSRFHPAENESSIPRNMTS